MAQVGADMAATSGGGAMKQPLIEKSDAKGDVLIPQDPQDMVMMTMAHDW